MVLLEDVSGQVTKIQGLIIDENICAERGESKENWPLLCEGKIQQRRLPMEKYIVKFGG